MTAAEAVKHRWVKRKPQYHPTNKPSQVLGFKAIPLETVSDYNPVQIHEHNQINRHIYNNNLLMLFITDDRIRHNKRKS